MKQFIILFLVKLLLLATSATATTYYINNAGDDAAAGNSPAHAWRTIDRVNRVTFQPGDRVLLAGGQVFAGSIYPRPGSLGTASQPLVFRSYGGGRATVQSGNSFGFYAYNVAGIELRNLAFAGSGRLSNKASGVSFYLDSADTQLQHLRLDSLDITGYQQNGLLIGSWNDLSGYSDVRITNCQLHANGEAGLVSYSFYPFTTPAHHDWYVGNCTVYDNSGRADITDIHTGNGIVLSGIDGVLIEKCTAYHNGWLSAWPSGGPVGIWGWGCNNLVIQHCESHHNQSGSSKDGGGFDLDGGCTNSVLQYNYSHDNQGPGYLLAQFDGAPAMHDLTIRYNISENDARGYDQGAIELWSSGANGGIVNANIYNNTVYLQQPANGSTPKAMYVMSGAVAGINLYNNIFQTSKGLPVLTTATTTGLRLAGNCYWTPNAPLLLDWAGTHFTTLSDWRAATGQELLADGTRPTGLYADPVLLVTATSSATATPLSSEPSSFSISSASALVGAGLSLKAEFGIESGLQDYFGNPTPALGAKGNIGASEVRTVLAARPATGAAAWCQAYPTVVHDELHLLTDQPLAAATTVQVIDLLGRQCRSWTLPSSQWLAGKLTLPMTGMVAGRYVLRVQSGDRLLCQALVVAAE